MLRLGFDVQFTPPLREFLVMVVGVKTVWQFWELGTWLAKLEMPDKFQNDSC